MNPQTKLKIGGLNNNGANLQKPLQSNPYGLKLPSTPNPSQNTSLSAGQFGGQVSPPKVGNVSGVLNPPVINVGGKSQVMKGNSSVLAQQKELNKQGAGLVEDGIAGDKTRAAIAQFGSQGTSTTTKTPKSITPEEYAKQNPELNPPPKDNTQSPIAPPPIDTKSNAERVIGTGSQTPQEKQTYEGLLGYGQGNESPQVAKARQDLLDAQKQFAQQTNDINQSGTWTSRALGEQGQANIQNSNVLNALQGTLSSALSSQGQQIGALGTAQSGAQTQASRAQGGAGTVFSSSLNQPSSYGVPSFNPLTGQFTGSGGVDTPANLSSISDFTTKINNIDSQSTAVDNNFSRAVNYATSAGLPNNSAILAGITNKVKSGVLPATALAGFNQAIEQINSQASGLGFGAVDPSSVTPDQLKQIQVAVKNKLANDKSNYQSKKDELMKQFNGSGTSGGTTGGNMFGNFFGN